MDDDSAATFMFSKLPYELKVHVFSFFEYSELCSNGQVNREWYSLSTENPLWKTLYYSHFPNTITINGGLIGDCQTQRDELNDDRFYKLEFIKEQKIGKTSKKRNNERAQRAIGINGLLYEGLSDIKCTFLGDRNVGKTTILGLYSTQKYISDYVETDWEDLYNSFTMAGSRRISLRLCDTPGVFNTNGSDFVGVEHYTNNPVAWDGVDVFILCFNLSDKESLHHILQAWLPLVRRYYLDTPTLLVGMKKDLRDTYLSTGDFFTNKNNKSKNHIVLYEDGLMACSVARCSEYIECSSLTKEGVEQIFQEILNAVVTSGKRASFDESAREDDYDTDDSDDDNVYDYHNKDGDVW